jgi:glycosyltransferase involved in cell wall biosynthesis
MKVLITCLSYSWGGMEMYTLQTAAQLRKRNIEIEILCGHNSILHSESIKQNFIVHTTKFRKYFHPMELLKLSRFFSEKEFDLIHSGGSKDLWLIVPSLKVSKKKTPLLLSKHLGSYITKKDFLHKWIYNRVNYVLAISNVIAKNLVDTTTLSKEKILLLHNGIDTNRFDSTKVDSKKIKNEFNISNKELLIGMMARFSPGKGHEEFLKSAKKLCKKFDNLRFLIVGEPSKGEEKYANEVKTLAANLDINKKIIFTGFRNDIPEILAAMDIFVFPSHAEAFGLALAEALSMGKPSVCSRSDGVLDIAVDGETSLLFEKQNWKDLTDKLEILINDKEMRNRFSLASRKRAIEMFDLKVFTDKLINIYNQSIIINYK